ncbi:antibiotic biosynthesis monooxygenase family protein [Yinghuangia soli]|uniref:Antibiotic biosynthesis monooxygenase n=1 Tax=Yinghuangia soli TaxID=2908204 RepID=A0AA41Q4T8_9ACTN|nr:antibiotic biosynthesis monooxygenase [Yinghuangia soli]MCF2531558.1 antibiotic biosynthesis monooxygenase [Yinghuangia soli]
MYVVVSQAWTLDPHTNADSYERLSGEFLPLLASSPGFLSRRLLRSVDDPTHYTNLRFFDSIDSYRSLITAPGYADRIDALSAHLRHDGPYKREFMRVVLDDTTTG